MDNLIDKNHSGGGLYSTRGLNWLTFYPPPLRNFSGKLETFKSLLDNFLSKVPDEPKTNSLIPKARDFYGKPSNSIYDWCKNGKIDWVSPVALKKIDDIYVIECKNCLDSEHGLN